MRSSLIARYKACVCFWTLWASKQHLYVQVQPSTEIGARNLILLSFQIWSKKLECAFVFPTLHEHLTMSDIPGNVMSVCLFILLYDLGERALPNTTYVPSHLLTLPHQWRVQNARIFLENVFIVFQISITSAGKQQSKGRQRKRNK